VSSCKLPQTTSRGWNLANTQYSNLQYAFGTDYQNIYRNTKEQRKKRGTA